MQKSNGVFKYVELSATSLYQINARIAKFFALSLAIALI